VIFFRHAATDSSQTDSDTQNLENCPAQRNLTEQGRSDARAIGQAFQTFGIPVGQVLASPYCRTLETARLAFERVEPSGDLLPTIAAVNAAEREALVAGLRRLLSTPPTPPNNTILVSHQFSLQDATGVSIAEGEAAVFEPLGANGFRLVARVLLNSWPTLMQTMSPQPEHFATGWMASEGDRGSVWGRPVDVLVLPDGSMLISDDDGGAIYRITYSTPASTP
jgi:phosphohistidine phosphatase SixA